MSAGHRQTRRTGSRTAAGAGRLVPGVGVPLPTWRLPDVADDFEVSVNSCSFQEMEPDVVEHHVELVCARGLRYAVSLNSCEGKPRAARPGEHGVLDPVTSDRIVEMFVRHGFRAVAQHDAPFVRGAGRLVVMARG